MCCNAIEAYGKPVDLKCTKPNFVFCADECDTNTNMANDKVGSGNKQLSGKGTKATLSGCTCNVHVTFDVPLLFRRCPIWISQNVLGLTSTQKWEGDTSVLNNYKNSILQAEDLPTKPGAKDLPALPLPAAPVELLENNNVGPGKEDIIVCVMYSELDGITPRILFPFWNTLASMGWLTVK